MKFVTLDRRFVFYVGAGWVGGSVVQIVRIKCFFIINDSMIQLLENLNDYEPSVQIYLYFTLIIDNSVWNYTSFTEFHTNVGISIFKRI